jgi:cephalosporin hydroxylase
MSRLLRRDAPRDTWEWSVNTGIRATRLWKLVGAVSERTGLRERRERQIVDRFNRLYYNSLIWRDTRWFGVWAMKPPTDLWAYQEILWETRPDLIVETGTFNGGSAFYLASICELIGNGRVVTIDLEPPRPELPQHERLEYVGGLSSTDPELRLAIGNGERVMVILDSNHTYAHVTAELQRYAPLVSPGCYLIVEDTNLNGHPIQPRFGPGPMEAVRDFLVTHAEFEVDSRRHKHLVTFHPSGYLRRRT